MRHSSITGIDISAHCIKAAVINTSGERVILKAYHEILTSEALFSSNNLFNYQEIVKKLQELKELLANGSAKVVVFIPDSFVNRRIIELDSTLSEDQRQYAVEQSLLRESTVPLKNLSIDFTKVADTATSEESSALYCIYATYKEIVENRIKVLTQVGFVPVVIEPESQTLLRLLSVAKASSDQCFTTVSASDILLIMEGEYSSLCAQKESYEPYIKQIPYGAHHVIENVEKSVGDKMKPFIESYLSDLKGQEVENEDGVIWTLIAVKNSLAVSSSIYRELCLLDLPNYRICLCDLSKLLPVANNRKIVGFEKAIALALAGRSWLNR